MFFFVIIEKKNKEPKNDVDDDGEGEMDDGVERHDKAPQQEVPDKKDSQVVGGNQEKTGLF